MGTSYLLIPLRDQPIVRGLAIIVLFPVTPGHLTHPEVLHASAIATAARLALLTQSRDLALQYTLEQSVAWARLQTGAGCAFAATLEDNHTLRWVAVNGPSDSRQKMLYQRHSTTRQELPALFEAVDRKAVVVEPLAPYDQNGGAEPGTLGGGYAEAGVMVCPIISKGVVLGILGVDLYHTDMKASKGANGAAAERPKREFTAHNIKQLERAADLTVKTVQSLLKEKDFFSRRWHLAFYEALQADFKRSLTILRDKGCEEIEAMKSCPPFEFISILDGILDIVLCKRQRKVGFPWPMKRRMFIDQHVWGKTLRFNCAKWEGYAHHGGLREKALVDLDNPHNDAKGPFQYLQHISDTFAKLDSDKLFEKLHPEVRGEDEVVVEAPPTRVEEETDLPPGEEEIWREMAEGAHEAARAKEAAVWREMAEGAHAEATATAAAGAEAPVVERKAPPARAVSASSSTAEVGKTSNGRDAAPLWLLYKWALSATLLLKTHYIHIMMPNASHAEKQIVVKEYAMGDVLPIDPYRDLLDDELEADLRGVTEKESWAPKSWQELDRKFSVQRLVRKQDAKHRSLKEKLLTKTVYEEEEPKRNETSSSSSIPSWAQGGSMNRTSKPAASAQQQRGPSGSKGPQKFTKRSSHVWVDYWNEVSTLPGRNYLKRPTNEPRS